MTIGNKIKLARLDKRMRQGTVAKAAKITQSTLCNIEREKTTPKVATLAKLCRVLEIEIGKVI